MELQQRQRLTAELRQEQQMTHQQIQALEMLSVPVLELEGMINTELENNPVLDTDGMAEEIPAETDDDEWLELILKLDENRRFLKNSKTMFGRDEERRQHYLESVTYEPSLHELIEQQLHFLDLRPEIRKCCDLIIAALDDDGYVNSHPADLAMAGGVSLEIIQEAVEAIQMLEPAGIAARNLRERLMLQLERLGKQDTLAYKAVDLHLDDLAANHLPKVARKLKISVELLQAEVISVIHGLSPHLNKGEVSPHEYIEEEVTVLQNADMLEVHMNNGYLPPLHISNQYRRYLQDPECAPDVRDYVKEKIRSGVFLINSIIQRQTTIQKISHAIVETQADFFHFGPDHLHPMTMAQVAEMVGVHETTVSRAVAGKYLRCKHGLIPLRRFFTTGYEDDFGNSISNLVVKNAIKKMIEEEDKQLPISDSQIARQLRKQGLRVARRTVAKYRECLGILPSNLRRKY
jgi:RNA polymerase sigma-54 factor